MAGTTSSSPSTTLWFQGLMKWESQMLGEKLVLVGDDGKPLKLCKSTLHSFYTIASKKVDDQVNEDSDSEVFEVYSETVIFRLLQASRLIKLLKVAVK